MPQMSPLSWLLLFIIFSFTLIIFNILNFFFFTPINNKYINNKNITLTSYQWKW